MYATSSYLLFAVQERSEVKYDTTCRTSGNKYRLISKNGSTGTHFQGNTSFICLFYLKASAHSFKRFTWPPFLKLSFSLCAPITSDECHAWFHLNAASRATRNTEQVKIIFKNLVYGRIRTQHSTAYMLQAHRLNHAATTRLIWRKELNVNLMYIYTIYINKLEHMHIRTSDQYGVYYLRSLSMLQIDQCRYFITDFSNFHTL